MPSVYSPPRAGTASVAFCHARAVRTAPEMTRKKAAARNTFRSRAVKDRKICFGEITFEFRGPKPELAQIELQHRESQENDGEDDGGVENDAFQAPAGLVEPSAFAAKDARQARGPFLKQDEDYEHPGDDYLDGGDEH